MWPEQQQRYVFHPFEFVDKKINKKNLEVQNPRRDTSIPSVSAGLKSAVYCLLTNNVLVWSWFFCPFLEHCLLIWTIIVEVYAQTNNNPLNIVRFFFKSKYTEICILKISYWIISGLMYILMLMEWLVTSKCQLQLTVSWELLNSN